MQFVLFWYCFQKTRQMTTVFLSYYCSNLMPNNSVRKLTSNAVNSQKKLCPDVMVQKTQHHVSTQWLQVQARLQPSCKVQLIVWHFFYLAVVSMKHLVFPQSVTTYSMEVLWCGIKNYLVQRTNYKLASLCCIADRLKCLHGQQRS